MKRRDDEAKHDKPSNLPSQKKWKWKGGLGKLGRTKNATVGGRDKGICKSEREVLYIQQTQK